MNLSRTEGERKPIFTGNVSLKNAELLREAGSLCNYMRKKAGDTLETLSQVLNCSKSELSQFENGRINSLGLFLGYVALYCGMEVAEQCVDLLKQK